MINPAIEGIAINMESLIDLDNVDEYSPDSFFWKCSDKTGSITIEIAIPNTAKGNSINLSEKYNQLILPVTNKEATIVSINRLIWTAAVPMIAGPMSLITLIEPWFVKLILGILRNPNLYINGSCISNWTTPATNTPYDNEITGITKSDDEKIVNTIKLKFKKTGVIPDKIKRSYELNIPAHIAVKEINNKYGNVINSISDVKLSLALSSANPGANT